MGNYRFKFSDMMPNAWFYKLRDMGRRRKNQITNLSNKKKPQSSSPSTSKSSKPKQTHRCNPRKSYYFTRELHPNKPQVSETNPRKLSSVSSDSSADSESHKPEFRTDRILPTESLDEMVSWSNSDDIVVHLEKSCLSRKDEKLKGFDSFSEFELPLITTKPDKFNDMKKETKPRSRMGRYEEPNVQKSLKVKILKEDRASIKEQRTTPVRRFKLRMNSPRLGSQRIPTHGRKSVSPAETTRTRTRRRRLSESLAIVKASMDPKRDFRESMVEMIVENNIRGPKDLEDLLACYLCLNSAEYHELIIEVFKQIWFDLTDSKYVIL